MLPSAHSPGVESTSSGKQRFQQALLKAFPLQTDTSTNGTTAENKDHSSKHFSIGIPGKTFSLIASMLEILYFSIDMIIR